MFYILLSLISVGLLWGATNPFIKIGSRGIQNVKADTKLKKILLEIKFLISTPSYLIPFLLNQCGSLLYIFTLQEANLSIAVPVANSLSFLFTAISGCILGECLSKNLLLGSFFVAIGSSLLIYDKY